MVVKKRCLLWDWTNTHDIPNTIDKVHWDGPISSVSNWNTWTPPELKGRAPFRPMVHLEPQLSGQDWKNVEDSNQPIIHFFNEPDNNGITPEHAADVWVKQMWPLKVHKGKKLVSPSCTSSPAGVKWIDDFMERVASHPPDYLGLHYYGTDVRSAEQYIEEMHKKHPHQHIIVSEIASTDRNHENVLKFTAAMANWMDETPWIFEYGFFGCMRHMADGFVSPEAQLMKPDGSFTDLMYKLMYDQPIKA